MTSIFQITSAMAGGDEEAFMVFYRAYSDRMRSYLLVAARGNSHLADDAHQDALLRAIRYARPFDGEQVLWCWLVRIMRTTLIDHIRKLGRGAQLVPLPDDDSLAAPLPDASPEEDSQGALLGHLDACLSSLTEAERALLDEHYFARKSQVTIAEEDGRTTPKAVGMRMVRIRQKLKDMLTRRLNHAGG